MTPLWTLRRRLVSQLDTAPIEKRAGLRSALRGDDLLLRATFEHRVGGWVERVPELRPAGGGAELIW